MAIQEIKWSWAITSIFLLWHYVSFCFIFQCPHKKNKPNQYVFVGVLYFSCPWDAVVHLQQWSQIKCLMYRVILQFQKLYKSDILFFCRMILQFRKLCKSDILLFCSIDLFIPLTRWCKNKEWLIQTVSIETISTFFLYFCIKLFSVVETECCSFFGLFFTKYMYQSFITS